MLRKVSELSIIEMYNQWVDNAIKTGIQPVIEVVKTFERHLDGIFNAIKNIKQQVELMAIYNLSLLKQEFF